MSQPSITKNTLAMLDKLALWPGLLVQGQRAGSDIKPGQRPIKNVLFCGLGGSAIAGDLVQNILFGSSPVPLSTLRDWTLPGWVGPDTLVFLLSYSGNTLETLRAAAAVAGQKCPIIVFSSGGQLTRLAQDHDWPLVVMPPGLAPRAALPFFIGSLLTVLAKVSLAKISSSAWRASRDLTSCLTKDYSGGNLAKNKAKQLAQAIGRKIPLILTVPPLSGVAKRWVNQFNENSKVTAAFSVFPELTHNEIVGLADRSSGHKYLPLILVLPGQDKFLNRIINHTRDLLKGNWPRLPVITARGDDLLSQIISLIILGDYASVYLAERRGLDPMSIEVIDALKKRLEKQAP